MRVVITVIPLVTMRVYAEEKHLGTIELLYTAPLRDFEILAAKFLACMSRLRGDRRIDGALSRT